MSADDISTNEKVILTYHRHLEAFKHAYAARSKLGSPYGENADFKEGMKQVMFHGGKLTLWKRLNICYVMEKLLTV